MTSTVEDNNRKRPTEKPEREVALNLVELENRNFKLQNICWTKHALIS